jgi:hypothetical protein
LLSKPQPFRLGIISDVGYLHTTSGESKDPSLYSKKGIQDIIAESEIFAAS